MSWHFSLGLEVAYSQAALTAGELSAQWKSTGTDGSCSNSGSVKELLIYSPSGTIYAPSMAQHGEDVLMWYLAAFPARPIPRRLEVATSRMISGRKCGESWQRQLPGTYLPRTPQDAQSTERRTSLRRWVTKPAALPFPRLTWVRTTFGPDIGFVHTPTVTANYAASSMQKWPGCRAFVQVFGQPSPEAHEYLMDWPTGWTDLKPLETDRWQLWLQRHGG
jgi:hypothetical protein